MKCVIPGLNIKIFARAIHSLARVGEELYVEPSVSGVFFRTVNSSRSAFGSFFFKPGFFSQYDFKTLEIEQEENFKCKVAMKACLNAFKSVNNIERSVEKCRLVIDPEEDRLVVNMTCRHGINKTYNLSFIECETLQAVFDKSSCHFGITSQSRVLCDAFVNFQSSQEEVTLSASPEKIFIRNYVDDDPDPAKSIHTELTLEADEFDSYNIEENCEVTFCLKEVRSLLSFSEPVNLPICLIFSSPGSPIIFTVENPPVFEANFVLATLSSTSEPTPTRNSAGSQQMSKQSNRANSGDKFSQMKRSSEVIDDLDAMRNQSRRSSEYIRDDSSVLDSKRMDDSPSSNTSKMNVKCIPTSSNSIRRRKSFELPSAGLRHSLQGNGVSGSREELQEEKDDEVVPGTPPAKRRKFFFKRCFEPTFDANNISAFRRILAEDSDEET